MPGCLGSTRCGSSRAFPRLARSSRTWNGARRREVKLTGQVRPTNKLVTYGIDFKRDVQRQARAWNRRRLGGGGRRTYLRGQGPCASASRRVKPRPPDRREHRLHEPPERVREKWNETRRRHRDGYRVLDRQQYARRLRTHCTRPVRASCALRIRRSSDFDRRSTARRR